MELISKTIIAVGIQSPLLINGPRHEVNHWKAANGFQEVVIRPVGAQNSMSEWKLTKKNVPDIIL